MRASRANLAALIVLLMDPASAQVYGGRAEGGTVVLSSFRSTDAPAVVVTAPGLADVPEARPTSADRLPANRRAQMYDSIVRDVASEIDIPAHLLHAVIAIESSYLPNAVSAKGAQGLMQLMPATARRFGVRDPFDPRDNVRGGAMYLKWLLQRFDGDLGLAIAGYNAGEEAIVRAGYRVPPFAETQRYVPRVLERLHREPTS